MALKVPDLLQYELRHRLERLGNIVRWRDVRDWVNRHYGWAIGAACLSVVLLALALMRVFSPAASASLTLSDRAWFYDAGTGALFLASSKKLGPIPAPSGPLPSGSDAGFRAHVYSYVLDPNEAELFVGFLERPDPEARVKKLTADMGNFETWAKGRQIKRPDDERWVGAASTQAEAILNSLLKPNDKGQTPIYQMPRS